MSRTSRALMPQSYNSSTPSKNIRSYTPDGRRGIAAANTSGRNSAARAAASRSTSTNVPPQRWSSAPRSSSSNAVSSSSSRVIKQAPPHVKYVPFVQQLSDADEQSRLERIYGRPIPRRVVAQNNPSGSSRVTTPNRQATAAFTSPSYQQLPHPSARNYASNNRRASTPSRSIKIAPLSHRSNPAFGSSTPRFPGGDTDWVRELPPSQNAEDQYPEALPNDGGVQDAVVAIENGDGSWGAVDPAVRDAVSMLLRSRSVPAKSSSAAPATPIQPATWSGAQQQQQQHHQSLMSTNPIGDEEEHHLYSRYSANTPNNSNYGYSSRQHSSYGLDLNESTGRELQYTNAPFAQGGDSSGSKRRPRLRSPEAPPYQEAIAAATTPSSSKAGQTNTTTTSYTPNTYRDLAPDEANRPWVAPSSYRTTREERYLNGTTKSSCAKRAEQQDSYANAGRHPKAVDVHDDSAQQQTPINTPHAGGGINQAVTSPNDDNSGSSYSPLLRDHTVEITTFGAAMKHRHKAVHNIAHLYRNIGDMDAEVRQHMHPQALAAIQLDPELIKIMRRAAVSSKSQSRKSKRSHSSPVADKSHIPEILTDKLAQDEKNFNAFAKSLHRTARLFTRFMDGFLTAEEEAIVCYQRCVLDADDSSSEEEEGSSSSSSSSSTDGDEHGIRGGSSNASHRRGTAPPAAEAGPNLNDSPSPVRRPGPQGVVVSTRRRRGSSSSRHEVDTSIQTIQLSEERASAMDHSPSPSRILRNRSPQEHNSPRLHPGTRASSHISNNTSPSASPRRVVVLEVTEELIVEPKKKHSHSKTIKAEGRRVSSNTSTTTSTRAPPHTLNVIAHNAAVSKGRGPSKDNNSNTSPSSSPNNTRDIKPIEEVSSNVVATRRTMQQQQQQHVVSTTSDNSFNTESHAQQSNNGREEGSTEEGEDNDTVGGGVGKDDVSEEKDEDTSTTSGGGTNDEESSSSDSTESTVVIDESDREEREDGHQEKEGKGAVVEEVVAIGPDNLQYVRLHTATPPTTTCTEQAVLVPTDAAAEEKEEEVKIEDIPTAVAKVATTVEKVPPVIAASKPTKKGTAAIEPQPPQKLPAKKKVMMSKRPLTKQGPSPSELAARRSTSSRARSSLNVSVVSEVPSNVVSEVPSTVVSAAVEDGADSGGVAARRVAQPILSPPADLEEADTDATSGVPPSSTTTNAAAVANIDDGAIVPVTANSMPSTTNTNHSYSNEDKPPVEASNHPPAQDPNDGTQMAIRPKLQSSHQPGSAADPLQGVPPQAPTPREENLGPSRTRSLGNLSLQRSESQRSTTASGNSGAAVAVSTAEKKASIPAPNENGQVSDPPVIMPAPSVTSSKPETATLSEIVRMGHRSLNLDSLKIDSDSDSD